MTSALPTPAMMDGLEPRTLLHGGPGGHHVRIPDPPSAAVQADLDKIKADKAQLTTDSKALRSTLRADQKAVRAAVAALDTQLAPLRDTLKSDAKAAFSTIRIDQKQLRADRRAHVDTTADKAKLEADEAAAKATLQADRDAIQAIIDADPAVTAAKAKLQTDSQPIVDDQAALAADLKQLKTDIDAQNSTTTA
jgi:hypothetical protein